MAFADGLDPASRRKFSAWTEAIRRGIRGGGGDRPDVTMWSHIESELGRRMPGSSSLEGSLEGGGCASFVCGYAVSIVLATAAMAGLILATGTVTAVGTVAVLLASVSDLIRRWVSRSVAASIVATLEFIGDIVVRGVNRVVAPLEANPVTWCVARVMSMAMSATARGVTLVGGLTATGVMTLFFAVLAGTRSIMSGVSSWLADGLCCASAPRRAGEAIRRRAALEATLSADMARLVRRMQREGFVVRVGDIHDIRELPVTP